MATIVDSFARDGFVGPVRLLEPREAHGLLRHLQSPNRPAPPVWPKGGAATDRLLTSLGSDPRMLQLLTPLLGDDIVLWGCELIQRAPGQVHPWHVDIESAAPDGRFVTVWIGLENTCRDTSVRLIAGSHRCGRTVQQCMAEDGRQRGHAPTEKVLNWALETNPDARLIVPEMRDGEAMLFDGRMWHHTRNRLEAGVRSALIMQFAAAECPVRMPDPAVLTWPFRMLDAPRPPAVLVQGRAAGNANEIVPAPRRAVPQQLAPLASSIHRLDLPLAEHPQGGWRPHPLFRGATPVFDFLSCHAAVLSPGHTPHAPHSHRDEELLIVLDGEAELVVADQPAFAGARALSVRTGDFAYYPAGQHHTIRNSGTAPVSYMMFRWRTAAARSAQPALPPTLIRAPAAPDSVEGRGFVTRRVLDGPTGALRKLHCHTSRIEPGAGYARHVDAYDVAILVRSGRVRTLGQEAGPGSLIYYPKGQPHGMRNLGDEPARYLVFEFHGEPEPASAGATRPRIAPTLQ